MQYKFLRETGCGQRIMDSFMYIFVFSACRNYKEPLQKNVFVLEVFVLLTYRIRLGEFGLLRSLSRYGVRESNDKEEYLGNHLCMTIISK